MVPPNQLISAPPLYGATTEISVGSACQGGVFVRHHLLNARINLRLHALCVAVQLVWVSHPVRLQASTSISL